jgi:predicted RNase H-like HicB family nuclease
MIVQVMIPSDDNKYALYHVIVYPADEGFIAEYPALPGCQRRGATLEEVVTQIRDALMLHQQAG